MSALDIIAQLKSTASKNTPDFFELEDGTFIWNASLVLLHYLSEKSLLKGKRVLELGSGLGHLAVGLYKVGAHVTCTERAKIMPELQASLRLQLQEQPGQQGQQDQGGSIEAVELEWGEAAFSKSKLSEEGLPKFDVIILAELVYNTDYHELLLWTIRKFCHPGIVIYSSIIDRPFSFLFFAKLSDEGCYEVETITDHDALGVEEALLCMHKITWSKAAPLT